jgi:hypothetical protein
MPTVRGDPCILVVPQSFPETQKAKSPALRVGLSACLTGAAARNRTGDLRITNAKNTAFFHVERGIRKDRIVDQIILLPKASIA